MKEKQIISTSIKIWLTSSILVGLFIGLVSIPAVGPMAIALFLMITIYALIFSVTSIFLLYFTFKLLDRIIAKKYQSYSLLFIVSLISFIHFIAWDIFMDYEQGIRLDFLEFSELTVALICSILAANVATFIWTRSYFDFKLLNPTKPKAH